MTDNEDKSYWCQLGEQAEQRFTAPLIGGCSVFMNPAKAENKFTHDFFIVMPCDLKTIRTRFNTADRYGIDSKTAFTINKKDIDRYSEKYPNIIVILDIDYGDFKTIRYASLSDLKKAIKHKYAKLHEYKNRVDDVQGNAKQSYVMNALWFNQFGGAL